jgi:hypothetical protein
MVTWDAPVCQGSGPITSYTVTSTPGAITSVTAGATLVTVSGLTNGTTYTFTVSATNVAGDGPPSAPSNAVTPTGPTDAGLHSPDCDAGSVEESAPLCMASPTCVSGAGQCRDVVQSCESGSWIVTQSEIGPSSELCNGLDDDCDGYTDNGPGVFANFSLASQCDSLCVSWNNSAATLGSLDTKDTVLNTTYHGTSLQSLTQTWIPTRDGILTEFVWLTPVTFDSGSGPANVTVTLTDTTTNTALWTTSGISLPASFGGIGNGLAFPTTGGYFNARVVTTDVYAFTIDMSPSGLQSATVQVDSGPSVSPPVGGLGSFVGNITSESFNFAFETSLGAPSGDVCAPGVGQCKAGSEACTAGDWGVCLGEVGPTAEVCNNLDDDCDGYTDDANFLAGSNSLLQSCDGLCQSWNSNSGLTGTHPTDPSAPCVPAAGQCRFGAETCASGTWGSCPTGGQYAEVGPTVEVCNNLDDDCDGYTDNSSIPYKAQNNTLSVVCSPLCSSWNRTYSTAISDAHFTGSPLAGTTYTNVSSFGQSFTVANSGLLESFTFASAATVSSPSDYDVELTRTSDGAIIASESVTSPQLTSWTAGSPLTINFTANNIPAPVTAGVQYIIRIYPSSAASYTPSTIATFTPQLQSGGSLYGGGSFYVNNAPVGTKDFSFSTIVLPSSTAVPDPCTPGVGQCLNGARQCTSGLESSCTGEIGPSAETCNGLDDDCDGYTDNVPGTPVSYSLPSCSP